MKITLLHLTILFNISTCRDFYLGMFKRNDLLMSQDTLFRERVPFRFTVANYGRTYKCPITYVRVLDRLNIGRGPRVEIIRGGLHKNYIVLHLTSPYNNPISVNIMVGCENKKHTRPPWKIIRPTKSTTFVAPATTAATYVTTTVAPHTTAATNVTTTVTPYTTADTNVTSTVAPHATADTNVTTTVAPHTTADTNVTTTVAPDTTAATNVTTTVAPHTTAATNVTTTVAPINR